MNLGLTFRGFVDGKRTNARTEKRKCTSTIIHPRILPRSQRDKSDKPPDDVAPLQLLEKLASLKSAGVEVHYVDRIGDNGDMAVQFGKDVAKRAKKEEGGVYLYFGHGTGTGRTKPTIDTESLKEFTQALAGLNSEKRGIGVLCCHAGSYLQGIPDKTRKTTPLRETGV